MKDLTLLIFVITPLFLKSQNCDFVGPSSQAASWSPDGKSLAYSSNIYGNWEIFIQSVDGDEKVRVTNTERQNYFPYFSPDGETLIYVSFNDSYSEAIIFACYTQTNEHIQLTKEGAFNSDPHWSPDGETIAFHSKTTDGFQHLFLLDLTLDSIVQLTFDETVDSNPKFSPDGAWVAFIREASDGDSEVYLVPASGGDPINLTNDSMNNYMPTWSPDARMLAFGTREYIAPEHWSKLKDQAINGMEITIMEVKNPSNSYFLTRNNFFEGGPQWSPDLNKICFTSCRDGYREIYISNIDGSEVKRITYSR